MRRFLAIVPLALLIVVGACTPTTPAAGTPTTAHSTTTVHPTTTVRPVTTTTAPSSSDWKTAMLTRINAERAAVGAAALQLCGRLTTAAQAHSADQAAHNLMTHTGSNGSTFDQRIEAAGYLNWNALAENVAAGYTSVDAVMTGWMNSPGHRTNLLSTSYVHVGVGQATSASGVIYWTQDFGRGGTC